MRQERLRDPYGRAVTYLRVSVTHRCNLRCFYCLPRDANSVYGASLLDLDEIAAVVEVAASLGVTKVRITGGEPLVRPGVAGLVRKLGQMPEITDLALSTNGTLLAEYAGELRAAGLMRVNVSLDSLRPHVFRAISGRSDLPRVLEGIEAARRVGLGPIKLNVVVLRGVNDDELAEIVAYASAKSLTPRFIEYMPMGWGRRWQDSFVPASEILDRIRPLLSGAPPHRIPGDTAVYYSLRTGGDVGVISPVSCRFCDLCNRLRLTAEGRLRPCLTREGEVDLTPALRPRIQPEAIAQLLRAATASRPVRGSYASPPRAKPMAAIGG